MSREFRAPCAGCGRKTPISKLYPVFQGAWPKAWYIDKRCERCGGRPAEPGSD